MFKKLNRGDHGVAPGSNCFPVDLCNLNGDTCLPPQDVCVDIDAI